MTRDGAADEAPFTFTCQRSGRCCTQGDGHVWLQENEAERIAGARGLSTERFLALYAERVGERWSVRSESGRCVLLEGRNECTVYEVRPRQCAAFPYWPEVLAGGEALEWARETCPGIQMAVAAERRREAFAQLEALYRELEEEIAAAGPVCNLRGICCDFEKMDHELFATRLETDFAASRGAEVTEESAKPPAERTLCPFWKEGRCTNREGRPLGCRIYHCDPDWAGRGEAVYEKFHGQIRKICQKLEYPLSYGRFISTLPWPAPGSDEP